MPRKESVDLVMRRAYRKRDVETLLWSFLKLTEEEIKKGITPRARTFNGRDINGFVQNLVQLEKIRKGVGDETPADEDEVWTVAETTLKLVPEDFAEPDGDLDEPRGQVPCAYAPYRGAG